jgi:hypothetical protein
MRGHQSITEARLNGYHPTHVWVILVDEPQPADYNPTWDPELLLDKGYLPEIHIYREDNIARADLRCLHGLTVHLVAQEGKVADLAKVAKTLMRFKPAALFACDGKQLIEHHHTEKQP